MKTIVIRLQRFWVDMNNTIEAQVSDKTGDNGLPAMKATMAARKQIIRFVFCSKTDIKVISLPIYKELDALF